MNILVTGGAGFIGSAVIRNLLANTRHSITNLDKLTYAGSLESLLDASQSKRYNFEKCDICDGEALDDILSRSRPLSVIHLAAESHVDRSISEPQDFILNNVLGTFTLLESVRRYYTDLIPADRRRFIFHFVSTDEVFGDLGATESPSTEISRFAPSSPYAASKASGDHMVRAWGRTYGLPITISNSSNNFGPYQFPEKLIPKSIINAIKGEPLTVFGVGSQIRDWIFVEDHARALIKIVTDGQVGEIYNVSCSNQKKNIEVVLEICDVLEEYAPDKPSGVTHYRDLIKFVSDRPGHDTRYELDARKITQELGWRPEQSFRSGLRKTVKWYIENRTWWENMLWRAKREKELGA